MPIVRKLDSYIVREVLGPFLLGLLVFTFILLMDTLFDVAATIIHRDVGALKVLLLLALNLPNILVLTIPMALLFGLLIAIGRLSADSELTAIRASGVSMFSLYRPLLAISLVLAGVTGWLIISVMPRASTRVIEMQYELRTANLTQELRPRVFHEEVEGRILYFFGTTPDGEWEGIFLANALPGPVNDVITAERGVLQVDEDGSLELSLRNSFQQTIRLENPDKLESRTDAILDYRILDQDPRASVTVSKGLRSMTLGELRMVRDDVDGIEMRRNLARVEIQKKYAIPAACLVLGLFGLPLGFSNRRGGRSSGFALSILVILVYYILLSNGEEAAATGRMSPWLAMWLPNIGFAVTGAFLLWRKNRDKSVLMGSIDRWVRLHGWGQIRARQRLRELRKLRKLERRTLGALANATDIVIRVPRLRLRFPNVFDRYVMRLFTRTLLIVIGAVLAVYMIANFTEMVDEVMQNEVPSSVVMAYYRYFSLQIFYQTAPIIVLLTTLTTFAMLSYSNEITAAKALGMSLYRLAIPAVVLALAISGLSVVLESYVLPYTNTRVAELHDVIHGRATRTFRRADRNWLFATHGNQHFIYNYAYYDPKREFLQRLQVFRYDDRHQMTGRMWAAQAVHRDGQWWVKDGWTRSFESGDSATPQVASYTKMLAPRRVDLPDTPEFFDSEVKSPDRMPFHEYKTYVEALKSAGEEIPQMEVQLHNKIAMPVVCVVMALVALPFAFRLGRRGTLYGVGLSLVLAIGFYAVIAFFTTLGEAGALPPAVAVWSPNVLFATMSLYLFLGVRT